MSAIQPSAAQELRIALTAGGRTERLQGGDFLYLPTGEPHPARGAEHASVLITVVLPAETGEIAGGANHHCTAGNKSSRHGKCVSRR